MEKGIRLWIISSVPVRVLFSDFIISFFLMFIYVKSCVQSPLSVTKILVSI